MSKQINRSKISVGRVGAVRRNFAQLVFKLIGWEMGGRVPQHRKCVIIAVPHTSSVDFFMMILMSWHFGFRINWMGTSGLFRWPFGWFFRRLGGIPIYRQERRNTVEQVVAALNEADDMFLVLSPEGTRSHRDHWKSGFYRMAEGANVPIYLGYLDFATKRAGVRPEPVFPTGDIEADMAEIGAFYEGMEGFKRGQVSKPRLNPQSQR
ncbi:MAG: 1-acyl-sn-glycerol-3-phosphate acyltransferase [Anaerolineales bacterium]|nr:1-acyl-sn-glycerol-3-phosphate acyltransferase [Anaerolineales bacterium]